jgi:alpha-1,3-mannosyltransferase
MRILQVVRRFSPYLGGVETYVRDLSKALIDAGHVSDVVTLQSARPGDAPLPADETLEGIRVFRVPAIGPARYRVAPAVSGHLREYDVIHIHCVDFFVDYLSRMNVYHRKPLILSTHGGIFHTPWMRLAKQLYFRTVTRLSLRRVNLVVCDSQHDFQLFQRIVSDERLRLLPNGVDLRPFRGVQKSIEPGLLVGIGRIVPNKGIDKLLQVLALLPPELRCARLAWIGDDPEGLLPALREQARSLGVADRVTWAGQVDLPSMVDHLARTHLFVSPSRYEAFGISTIEAMSSGSVPFVSPVGIHPNVVVDGGNGFLVDFDRPALAARRLQGALALPSPELLAMGERAREEVERFAWEVVVRDFIDVYEEAYEMARA